MKDILKSSKAVRQINFSIHSIIQNENLSNNYLQDIFNSVEELENIIISYRLWNLKSIKEYCYFSNDKQQYETNVIESKANIIIPSNMIEKDCCNTIFNRQNRVLFAQKSTHIKTTFYLARS